MNIFFYDFLGQNIKERYQINFIKEIPLKKVHKKIEIAFKFKWKILYKLIGPRKKITREFPLNLIWFHFTGKSFVFFSTFSTISKKSNLEGVFEFLHPDPQLDQNFTPTKKILRTIFLYYVYLSMYEDCAQYICKRLVSNRVSPFIQSIAHFRQACHTTS